MIYIYHRDGYLLEAIQDTPENRAAVRRRNLSRDHVTVTSRGKFAVVT